MMATSKQHHYTTTKNRSSASKVVIHMGAGVHELTITDPSSPTLRNHTVSLNGATRKQKEAVVVALCTGHFAMSSK